MTIRNHLLPVEKGTLPLSIAQGDAAGAAVVIMPSAFGVGSDLLAQMDDIAEYASLVVAIDPFFREDPGPVPYDDFPRVKARMQALDRERAHADFRATIDWARANTRSESVVGLGICFGGPYMLIAAADGALNGVVTWHGTRMNEFVERAADMRCAMRLHFGRIDPVVPPPAVEAVAKAFAHHHDARIVVHEGATHGFSHRSAAQAYNEPAERAGMDSVRELASAKG
jgi:carboxymethylenebutenolidase